MIMRKIKTGIVALVAIIAIIGTVNAAFVYLNGAKLDVTPQNFGVIPGRTVKIVAKYTTPVDSRTTGAHVLTYDVVRNFPVNVSVESIYYYNKTTGAKVTIKPFGYYPASYGGNGNVSWHGGAHTYYIVLLIGASPNATPGTDGSIALSASSSNTSFKTGVITVYTSTAVANAYPTIMPELFTSALVGAGIAAVVLIRRREF